MMGRDLGEDDIRDNLLARPHHRGRRLIARALDPKDVSVRHGLILSEYRERDRIHPKLPCSGTTPSRSCARCARKATKPTCAAGAFATCCWGARPLTTTSQRMPLLLR